MVIVKLGEKHEVLATNTLAGQFFMASPIIVDGSLYLRSTEARYCVRSR